MLLSRVCILFFLSPYVHTLLLPFSRRQDADMGMGIESMGYDVVDADIEMRWMEGEGLLYC
jgi:hypothetical protein